MTVTFFGNRDASVDIKPKLRKTIIQLITEQDADNFYVGNNGNFDRMVTSELIKLQKEYPHINYGVVLAYFPKENPADELQNKTLYPESVGNGPARFAICRRNDWLINNSDIVVTYVKYSFGGAQQYKELASKKNKKIIELLE